MCIQLLQNLPGGGSSCEMMQYMIKIEGKIEINTLFVHRWRKLVHTPKGCGQVFQNPFIAMTGAFE